ncbi:MAG: FtsX-like permease family protein [Oscillospiraceae bacterium]|nr:FtsX-like permease family protein [Oscillospiraceae bacterium]MDY3065478.1 FtsX-like permease family protein [Oscillospiraceae bacterium]
MNIMHRVTLKSMIKNKRRTIVTIIGVIISVAMITAVSTFSASISSLFRRQEIYENGDWIVSFRSVDPATAAELEQEQMFDKTGYSSRDFFIPLDSSDYMEILFADQNTMELNSMKVTRGRLPQTADEICLPEGVEELSFYQIGDEIELSYGIRMYEGDRMTATASYADGESFRALAKKTFTITGFCEGYGIRRYFPNAVAGFSADALPVQAQLSLTARTAKIQTDTYGQVYDLAQQYGIKREMLQFHNTLLNYSGVMSDLDLFTTLLIPTAIIGLIIMVGSIMLIYNAFAISVSERSKQLGMLASVGATRRQKRGSVLFEGLVIGIIAIPLGIVCGIAGIGITFWAISPWIMSAFSLNVPFRVEVVPIAVLGAVLFSAFTIFISAWIPAKRASKITPIEAIRQSQDVRLRARSVKTSWLTKKLFGFEGELAMKNLKRNRKRYRATIFALCISVVLFLSTAGFNSYMTLSYGMTRESMPYDVCFYTYPDTSESETSLLGLPQAEEAERNRSFRLDGELPYSEASRELKALYTGQASESIPLVIEVFALDSESQARYLEKAGLDPYLLDEKNSAVAVNRYLYADGHNYSEHRVVDEEQVSSVSAYYNFYTYEDEVETVTRLYTEQPFSIQSFTAETPLCVTEKTGCESRLVLIVSDETMNGLLSGLTAQAQSIVSPEGKDEPIDFSANWQYCYRTDQAEALCDALKDYDIYAENMLVAKAQDQNMLNVLNVFLYGFITLITLISAANIFNTVSTSISLRTREFAMLRSVGMTKQSLNRMLRFESMFYGMKALLWGIPISVLIEFLMYGGLSRNFSFGFYLPVVPLVIVVLAIFVIVGLTMLYSASKVKKANIISILTQENI